MKSSVTENVDVLKADVDVSELVKLPKDELIFKIIQLRSYVDQLENKPCDQVLHKLTTADGTADIAGQEERLRQQQLEASRRENVLVMRLTTKEQEVQEYLGQLEELRSGVGTGVRNVLLDPAVNSLFQKMKQELKESKEKLEQSQQELNAWKFTPDSTMGKRLLTKCRMLIQENEELGRMTSSGRISKLEGDLALAKSACEELKKSQTEIDDFLLEMDEDMEGMQATVMYLQQQVNELRAENQRLRLLIAKTGDVDLADSSSRNPLYSNPPARAHATSHDEPAGLKGVEEIDSAESIESYSSDADRNAKSTPTFAELQSPAWIENNSEASSSSEPPGKKLKADLDALPLSPSEAQSWVLVEEVAETSAPEKKSRRAAPNKMPKKRSSKNRKYRKHNCDKSLNVDGGSEDHQLRNCSRYCNGLERSASEEEEGEVL